MKIYLHIALNLLLALLIASCATKPTPAISATAAPSQPPTQASTETPIVASTTATPVIANGQEPPPCTFPLAQIKPPISVPEIYTFSNPKVVLTAPKGNFYVVAQWLPDNQQFLLVEALRNIYDYSPSNNNIALQSISLYNPESNTSKVYAIRAESSALPLWLPTLNALVYPATNYTSIDKTHSAYKYTLQARISYGDPNNTQLLADNLSQFPIGVKPDGSEVIYLSDHEIYKLDKSLKVIHSVPFDPAQWDYAANRTNQYPIKRNQSPAVYSMEWQPGTSLVFLYSNGSFGDGGYTFILNTDTGKVCELNLGGWAAVAHWSLDGRYLAIIRATEYTFPIHTSDLVLLDTFTGGLTTLAVNPKEQQVQHLFDFTWAPDSRHILVLAAAVLSQDDDIQGLYLLDFVSGQSANILPAYKFKTNSSQSVTWSPDGSKVVVLCPTNGMYQICFISVHQTGQ